MIPLWITANITRICVYAALAVFVAGFFELDGYRRGEKQLFDYRAEQAMAAVVVVRKIEKVKEIVRVPFTKREIQIEKQFVYIEKETAHVPDRPLCHLTLGWVHEHNAAVSVGGRDEARGALPIPELQSLKPRLSSSLTTSPSTK